ncbi:MAG: hypothetical protein M0P31_15555 [Solirubrobacteraceae bacterium]|nr:hypothetical protein [Solirubrobacteraceae bacterium]
MDPNSPPSGAPGAFPQTGYRARRWSRFERDLHEWLDTPTGRFACWRARVAVNGTCAPQPPGGTRDVHASADARRSR